MTNIDGKYCWAMFYDKYCLLAETKCRICLGKTWFKVAFKGCYPSELRLSSIYRCDCRYQGVWSPMVTRNDR